MIRAKRAAKKRKRFREAVARSIAGQHYLWIRAGAHSEHKFTGIWSVVVAGRVFVRSWDMRRSGWYESFQADRLGAVRLGEKALPVRSSRVRGERLLQAIDRAYAAKYVTPASLKYVKGFARGRRRDTTTELSPR